MYLDPFATPVWQILFIYCCLCSVVIQLVALAVQSNKPYGCIYIFYRIFVSKRYFRSCYLTQTVKELVYNYYIVFRSNLGGAPFPIQGDKTFQMKSLLFSIFFASNIVWMSYRASLTSELSSMKLKLPFSTLEELLQSNYRLIIKGGGSLHATFTGAKEGTIYHSLYRVPKFFILVYVECLTNRPRPLLDLPRRQRQGGGFRHLRAGQRSPSQGEERGALHERRDHLLGRGDQMPCVQSVAERPVQPDGIRVAQGESLL